MLVRFAQDLAMCSRCQRLPSSALSLGRRDSLPVLSARLRSRGSRFFRLGHESEATRQCPWTDDDQFGDRTADSDVQQGVGDVLRF